MNITIKSNAFELCPNVICLLIFFLFNSLEISTVSDHSTEEYKLWKAYITGFFFEGGGGHILWAV